MKHKILVYYLLFNIIIGSFFGVYLYLSYSQEKSLVMARTTLTSLLISEWIKGAFIASDYVLREIVETVPVSALTFPASDPFQHAKISAFIDKKRKTIPYANGVGLNNANCIVTHTPSVVGFDASQREWCYVPMNNTYMDSYVSNMFLSNINEMMVIQVRKFADNQGLAGLGVNLDFFYQWLKKVNVGKHGSVAIADIKLSLLARQPEIADTLGNPIHSSILEKFIHSKQLNRSFSETSPLDKEQRLYSVRKVDGLPFLIIVGEADRDWLAGWYKQVVISIFITLLLWAMAWIILRHYLQMMNHKTALEKISVTDQLTGLYNRYKLNQVLDSELHRAERIKSTFGIIILDIDNFKKVNDVYGHNVGDSVLQELAILLKKTLRITDTLGRWGGEELLIIVPEGSLINEKLLAEKLRVKIEKHTFTTVNRITTSFGVAIYNEGDSIIGLIKRADDALYHAKRNGRNQVSTQACDN
jgi:diguanylate cyclase (GGDEF)-like protein